MDPAYWYQGGHLVGYAEGEEYYPSGGGVLPQTPSQSRGGFYSFGRSFFRSLEEKLRGSNTLPIRTPAILDRDRRSLLCGALVGGRAVDKRLCDDRGCSQAVLDAFQGGLLSLG
jgi:hypothetical protein